MARKGQQLRTRASYRAQHERSFGVSKSFERKAISLSGGAARRKLRGTYRLGFSYIRANLTREKEVARKRRLHEQWGAYASAVDAKARAKARAHAHEAWLVAARAQGAAGRCLFDLCSGLGMFAQGGSSRHHLANGERVRYYAQG